MTQVNVDTVINAYVKLRDAKGALKKAFDDEVKVLDDKMDKLELWLMKQMETSGATQLGSAHGTAYRQIKYKASCSDWPSYWEWLAANNRLDMLEKRISLGVVQEYIETNNDVPPGVSVNPEAKVVIRRS